MNHPHSNPNTQNHLNSIRHPGNLWVIGQVIAILTFILLPRRPLLPLQALLSNVPIHWLISLITACIAFSFLGRGMLDLGANLTPSPYPRSEGQLVQTGMYRIIRHPLYSGLLLLGFSWSLYTLSWPHAIGTVALGLFLTLKADREEKWLTEKYPDYAEYQKTVKKIIPFIY